jgi:hypothetical protein
LLFFNYVTSGSVFKRLLGRLERPAREQVGPMAAMKCVACAAPPQAPHTPKAGLRTRPLEEWALIAAPGRPDCRKPVGRLAVARVRTFAVITVPANALIAPIHERMLAILPSDQFPRWLSDEADPRDLLVLVPADQLAVSPQRSRR